MVKPPIVDTVVASYVFLFRNFGHAVKMGWPFILVTSLSAFFSAYLAYQHFTFLRQIPAPSFEQSIQFFEQNSDFHSTMETLDLIAAFLWIVVCIAWARAVTQGISSENACKIPQDIGLIFYLVWQCILIALIPIVLFSIPFFLLFSMFSMAFVGTAMHFVLFFFLSFLIIVFSPLLLVFPARVNGQNIGLWGCWTWLKGHRLRIGSILFLCALPYLVIQFLVSWIQIDDPLTGSILTILFVLPSLLIQAFSLYQRNICVLFVVQTAS